jgi:thermolysin
MARRARLLVFLAPVAVAALQAQPVPPATIAAISSGASGSEWVLRAEAMLHEGTLDLVDVQADTMLPGRTHERLEQRYDGLPVFGGQLVRQRSGQPVVSVWGRIFDHVSVPSVAPAIDAVQAQAIAEREAGAGSIAEPAVLGILPDATSYVLAFRTIVHAPGGPYRYDVDARTGAIVDVRSEIRDQQAVGSGRGVLGDEKKVVVRPLTVGFHTIDTMRPAAAATYALDGTVGRFNAFNATGAVFASDLGFSTLNTWSDAALVDAHAYIGWTYDYYGKVFGRRGMDDRNLPPRVVVHPIARAFSFAIPSSLRGLFVNNAFYSHPGLIVFGDGDGGSYDYFAGSIDVVAHEYSHGVTAFTSNLIYRDEPGALNEAFSDIMGTGAEFYHLKPGQGPQRGPNFLLGEDITRSGAGYIRSMQNPNSVGGPDHYSLRRYIGTTTDNGGVHFNSTIVSHAFYLAVAGGTNRVSRVQVQGIGTANIDRMLRVFYRGFAFFLTPSSQFSDARAATLQAAADLYGAGSTERAQLQQAWTAVGVN